VFLWTQQGQRVGALAQSADPLGGANQGAYGCGIPPQRALCALFGLASPSKGAEVEPHKDLWLRVGGCILKGKDYNT